MPMFSFNYGAFSYDHGTDKIYASKYDWVEVLSTGKSTIGGTFGFIVKNKKNPNRGISFNFLYRKYSIEMNTITNIALYDNNNKYTGFKKTENKSIYSGNFGALLIGFKL